MPNHHIDAAFRSSKTNECYVFVKKSYMVLNYAPGAKKEQIIHKPNNISNGFPFVVKTPFENVIDCAFETEDNQAFVFSGNQCAKIQYGEHAKLIEGFVPITTMFPCLKGKVLENGIDAAIKFTGSNVFLFKGDEYVRIDYHSKTVKANRYTRNGFKSLVGTIFESGIDAAFASHVKDQAYVFKGEYYACINIANGGDFIVNGRIKKIHDDWPALHDILTSNKISDGIKEYMF